jgi:hypothetical protein
MKEILLRDTMDLILNSLEESEGILLLTHYEMCKFKELIYFIKLETNGQN